MTKRLPSAEHADTLSLKALRSLVSGLVDREEILRINPRAGSPFKGNRSCYIRDLPLVAENLRYRRECWITPIGKTMLAPMPARVAGSYRHS